ncbi:MAG TPA: APC family permease [Acidimicrobiia bacterium]|nr:APC family permease [Acidimicrobiia bacterium]
MYAVLKRLLLGRPLRSADQEHQRLIKLIALAIFSSDAISSTAYATEEILHVLVPLAGMAALEDLIPISFVVVTLLAIVVFSYRQTIFAYPDGGGSYVVSKENLGETPALVAGASLLVDYTLTVAVSVSAGVAAITSAVKPLADHRVELGLILIVLVTVGNLRGIKEAGQIFAVPTYIYMGILGLLIVWGLWQSFTGDLHRLPVNQEQLDHFTKAGTLMTGVTLFALMRAFSSGAVALTGIEAISNAVPAFKRPESKNAATTLGWMAVILGVFFFGISLLAHRLGPTLSADETILSILGTAVFGRGTLYIVLQASTAAILTLAANTAFSGFPLLASIIARDGYLPRQLATRGDRLAFSNGIVGLAAAAAILLIAFGGETTALIPLYAVGVFTSFTLSQWGMVQRHRRLRESGWLFGAVVNCIGAIATGIVLLVVLVSKFTIGAWIPAVVIPLLVLLLRGIKGHYRWVGQGLRVDPGWRPLRHRHTVVLYVEEVHQGALHALSYARSLAPDKLVAVAVVSDLNDLSALERDWARHGSGVPLEIIYSPTGEISRAVIGYVDQVTDSGEIGGVTVLIPELAIHHWWEELLHNQIALSLKGRLLFRPGIVVTSVPYRPDAADVRR